MSYWYFSFVDPSGLPGYRFLGGCYIELADGEEYPIPPHMRGKGYDDMAMAIKKSYVLGCNPGGEVAAFELHEVDPVKIAPLLNRLLTKEQIEAMPKDSLRK